MNLLDPWNALGCVRKLVAREKVDFKIRVELFGRAQSHQALKRIADTSHLNHKALHWPFALIDHASASCFLFSEAALEAGFCSAMSERTKPRKSLSTSASCLE